MAERKTGKKKDHQTEDFGGDPFVVDIEKATLDNKNFRTTVWTGKKLQLTYMAIPKGGDIGLEVHPKNDQFLRVEQGKGKVQMGPKEGDLSFEEEVADDYAILVPAGTWHNVTNIGDEPLKLYALYGPPDHEPGTVHKTQKEATEDPNED